MRFIDPDGNLEDWWALNDGSLLNVKNTSELPSTISEANATRIGGDDFFGKDAAPKQDLTVMNPEDSKKFADDHGFQVVPTQTLVSDKESTIDVKTGPKSVNWTSGSVTTINEKYDVVPKNTVQENTTSKMIHQDIPIPLLAIGGDKSINRIERETYSYKQEPASNKVGGVLKSVFNFLSSTLSGKHTDKLQTTYKSWNEYLKSNTELKKYIY
jgi:hypothetical protein